MTATPANLSQIGPLLALKLWVPRGVQTTTQPIDTLAEINTASTFTYVQEGTGTSLGLTPAFIVQVTSITHQTYNCYAYKLRIVFQAGIALETNVVEVPYLLHHYRRIKCRLGRDILQYGILTYNRRANTFSFDLKVGR